MRPELQGEFASNTAIVAWKPTPYRHRTETRLDLESLDLGASFVVQQNDPLESKQGKPSFGSRASCSLSKMGALESAIAFLPEGLERQRIRTTRVAPREGAIRMFGVVKFRANTVRALQQCSHWQSGLAAMFICGALAGCSPEEAGDQVAGGGGAGGGPPLPNSPSGTLSDVEPGDIVGKFEVVAGEVEHFPLHGTLPVPKDTFPRTDGKNPFTIVDSSRNVYPTQTEIVSHYANEADGADVVELISRVSLPEGTEPGDRVQYSIMYSPLAAGPSNVTDDVNTFFATPEALTLRTRDCFNHEYTANLLADLSSNDAETLKSGALCEQFKTYENLEPITPVEGGNATLPHLMGVHAYVTRWAQDDFISLDLRIHNGHSGLDPNDTADDPLGTVYFKSLELRLPVGWSIAHAFENPYVGTPYVQGGWKTYPIVAPITGGKLHVMRAQAQFERRLVIYKDGYETAARSLVEEQGLAFCRKGTNAGGDPFYSWWNPWTSRYFPQNITLPDLSYLGAETIRTRDTNRLNSYYAQMHDGVGAQEPIVSDNQGWGHPYGVAYGGVHGGTGIWQYDGVMVAFAASLDGYRQAQLLHRMKTERQPTCIYNADGKPTEHDQWIVQGSNGPYMPAWMFMRPVLTSADPFGFLSTPSFQRDYVDAAGLKAPYEDDHMHYSAIDLEHIIRYTRAPKVLTWLGNDALSKDDLRMQAELYNFSYNVLPQTNAGEAIGTGMLHDMNYVAEHPGWGLKYGRSEGWGLDLMTAYYAVASSEWRADHIDWFEANIDMLEAGQSTCDGTITASSMGHMFSGQYRNRQSIEACIVENAMWSMARTVFEGADEDRRAQTDSVLRSAIYGMVSAPVWDDARGGPWSLIAMGPYDVDQPPFCGQVMNDGVSTGPDLSQIWSNFAYGSWLSNDPLFVQKGTSAALIKWGNSDLLSSLQNKGFDNLNNTIPLLTLLQASGGSQ